MPQSKAIEREGKGRFWFLFADATVSGYVSLFVDFPNNVRSVVFRMSDQLPGGPQVIGSVLLTLAMLLLVARFTSSRFLRVVHAFCCGIYGCLALGLVTAFFFGEPYTAVSGFHLAVIAWVHYDAGTEQDPLTTKEEDDNG